jgi:hypothetical protein
MTADEDGWTEADLQALAPSEHDFQEFKASAWLYQNGQWSSHFRDALSKAVSAFANGAGGKLFIGIDDNGHVDGGVPVDLRGGTRSWLEDVVVGSVDPPLTRFNVYEVCPTSPSSAVRTGHAVYVLHLPASSEAPHQARDYRYYMRMAGKSRPMGNTHISDVRRRTRAPRVTLARLTPYGGGEHVDSDPRGPMTVLQFRCFIANHGRTMAQHVGVELALPRPLVNRNIRSELRTGSELTLTQTPGHVMAFRYLSSPLFPGQERMALHLWLAVHDANANQVAAGLALKWKVYADDAPPVVGAVVLNGFSVVREAVAIHSL